MHNHSGTEFSVALYNNFNVGDRYDLQRAGPSQQHQLHTPFESRAYSHDDYTSSFADGHQDLTASHMN
jgi:hypothetical protein